METRAALLDMVKELASRGSAVLYSTHYLQEVEVLDASVVILEHGKVIATGSVAEMVAKNGGAFVELTFDGEPPSRLDGDVVAVDGPVIRVRTDDPGRSLAKILASMGSDAGRLHGVEVISPSLETVYLTLTGHRYEAGEELDVVSS